MNPLHLAVFALDANPGVYALLLGSGISSAAGVPTGGAIMEDLIRQVAALHDKPCDPSPAKWYERTFSKPATYSDVLSSLASTSAERQALLRPYFEPTHEEASRGLKMPGLAHHAIARLASLGRLRIIVTTNFDRLVERALEDAGMAPVVVSTAEHAASCAPLAHQRVLVFKVNGDYLDLSLRNSTDELSDYPSACKTLLNQIFAEYGLIVCGWSATSDHAVRKLLERSRSRRYSLFWVEPGVFSKDAEQLVRKLEAHRVTDSADTFFQALADSVEGLSRYRATNPVSRHIVLARLKRYLSEPKFDIELREILSAEALKVAKQVHALPGLPDGFSTHGDAAVERVRACDGVTDVLRAALFVCGHFGQVRHLDMLIRTIQTAAPAPPPTQHLNHLTGLRDYHGMILFYAAGVGAMSAGNAELYCGLLCAGKLPRQREASAFVDRWYAELVHNHPQHPINVPEFTGRTSGYSYAPLTAHVRVLVQELGTNYMREEELHDAFDRWDLLVSLFRAHCQQFRGEDRGIAIGLFGFHDTIERTKREVEELGSAWPPLKHGLFSEGSSERVMALLKSADEWANRERAKHR